MCAIDMHSLQTSPLYDVVSHLIYATSSQQVSHVWVGGRMLVENFKLQNMDIEDIIDRAEHWSKRIAAKPDLVGVQVS
jgi:5-methylthioadenosine/S-adenosylhomocysteine deaminase